MKLDLIGTLKHYAQGLLMGSADVIPGVSGGTMALIVGIYERLIDSISSAFSMIFNLLGLRFKRARLHAREVEWGLVLPVLFGIVCAIVVAAQLIPPLLEEHPHEMHGLFFGLVLASIAVPWLRISRITGQAIVIALAAAAAAFFIVGLPLLGTTEDPGLLRVFLSAAVAICAMILPGVSGAFLLKVMGIYEVTIETLKAALSLDPSAMGYVLVFCLGAATGLGLFSKLLDYLLNRYHDRTMAALVGLMAGSLRALWPWQPWAEESRTLLWPAPGDPVADVLLLGMAGFAFVAFLTWWGARKLKADAPGA